MEDDVVTFEPRFGLLDVMSRVWSASSKPPVQSIIGPSDTQPQLRRARCLEMLAPSQFGVIASSAFELVAARRARARAAPHRSGASRRRTVERRSGRALRTGDL